MEKSLQEHHALTPPDEALGQNCGRFKGIRMRKWGKWVSEIRMRKWGKWVSEIRMPKSREKIWLGSYKTAEQAARAYDAAGYCLRGLTAKRNFPSSVPDIPSASSLSRKQIQVAAAKYALDEIPSTSPSLHNIKSNNNNNKAREKPASPSRPSSVSETNLTCDNQQISEDENVGFWESPFDGNGGGLKLDKIPSIDEMSAALDLNFPVHGGYPYIFLESINGNGGGLKLDKIPSINEMSAELDLNFPVQEAYPYIFVESTELWNFGDVCGTLETFE